jgi:phospholipid:diacylglycerol acyltransferase
MSLHKSLVASDVTTVGALLGFSFIPSQNIQDMQANISLLMNDYDIGLPQLPDLNFTVIETEWKRLRSSIPEVWKFSRDGREFQASDRSFFCT